MAIPINNQILAVIPTPLDPKRTNCYIVGSSVVIETIAQYLLRVTPDIRDTHVVSMRIPKTGHEGEEGVYPIEDFGTVLANFDSKLYSFTGGLADADFQEIVPDPLNYGLLQFISGNTPPTPVVDSQYMYMRSYGTSPNKTTILAIKNHLGTEIILTSLIT